MYDAWATPARRLDLRIELRRVPPGGLCRCRRRAHRQSSPRASRPRPQRPGAGWRRLNAESRVRVTEAAALGPAARRALADIAEARTWSARGVHRVLRIARTIADLGGATTVDPATLHAAAGLRDPQEQALAA